MKQIPYISKNISKKEAEDKSLETLQNLEKRRSLRFFSDKEVSKKTIENILLSAGTAPSGAHKQPWYFCAISNSELKSKIRIAAEKEEKESYDGRMSDEWLNDLKQFETNWEKPFIDIAPWIIVVFKKPYDIEDNKIKKNYYVNESVGIAAGFLINSIHNCGLVALTHTPSPLNFLNTLLNRPKHEKPILLIPIGYPADNATVPNLKRKPLEEISSFYE